METIIDVVGGIGRVVAIFGGVLSAVFVAYAGIQWMTATGDPQKMSQARMSLVGAVVGLIIVGVAFLIPGVISELVIEPAGGIAVEAQQGTDCDGIFRRQLVVQRAVSRPEHMNYLIARIQGSRDECRAGFWNPFVHLTSLTPAVPCLDVLTGTASATNPHTIGGVVVPSGLLTSSYLPRGRSSRDSNNDIIVHFRLVPESSVPSDGAVCWLYDGTLDIWVSGGADS